MTLFSTTQNHGGSRFRRFITLLALMLFSFLANESFAQELLCSDGIDNDGDGWIDCSDIDCAASIISVPVVQPTACPAANNGSITINVSGGASPVEYSINGGTTYAPTSTFSSLSPGVYNVRVRSGGATGCVSSYPSITLYSSCSVDVCQETGISTFQVTPVVGATSYDWTVDGGTVGIVGNGQGTVQIQVNLALLSLGVHNICATCSNACGTTAPTCYTINVIACTPNAVDDIYTGNEDSPINGTTVGVNDTDPNNNLNPTGFAIVTPPTVPGVSFVFNPNGTFTYTPTPNFNGPVTFTYQACDLSTPTPLCDTATVTLNINPVNDAPLAVNDSGITPEDTPITLNVPSNDTDSDGVINPATVTITTPPTNGTITAVSPTGGVTYTPNPNFTGTDVFFYRICDDGSPVLCDTAQVTVTVTPVNDPPAVIPIPQVTPEDTPFGPVCFPITDEAADNHTVVVCGVTNGTATASVNNATDEVCINFAPASNYNGPASICLTICDNGSPILCTTVNVPINVTPVNDPPIATDDVLATPEDAPLSATVAPNDDPTDGPTSVFSLTATDPVLPAEGTIVFNVDGSFVFTPTANFVGPVTFTYQICDGATPNLCDEAVATIIVGSLNDTPVVPVTPQTTPEDTPFGPVCFPIIDDAADNHTVLVCGVDNGTATASVNNLTDEVCINFTPTPNYNGPASICLTVCDNGNPILCTTVDVPITVVPANDPPVAVDDIFAGAEDAITTGSVAPNDNPTDGPSSIFSLTPTDAVTPAEGVLSFNPDGSFVFTPTTNFNGVVTFTYQICDGATPSLCDEAVATLIIGPVNDAPIAVDDTNTTNEDTPVSGDVTPGTPGQDSDPDGNPLTVSILDTPDNGSIVINPNGTYTYTPDPNFNGQDVFTYQVCDNGLPALCDEATVIITVTPVNDPPVAINDTYPGTEDVTVNGSVATNDDPTDGPSAIFTTTATDPVLATEGTLTLNPDGTFVFNPAPNFFGTVTFTYQICDGATPNLCDEAVATIVVAPVNDVPVVPVTPQTTPEDSTLVVCFPIIDDAADNHTVTVCGVEHGTVNATINNTTDEVCITFVPDANYNGPAEVCLTVCDNGNPVLCTTVIVPITVTPVNDPPVAVDDVVATPEDTPLSSTVAPNDNPTDGPISTFSLTPTDAVNPATEGTLTFNPDGSFVFTPVANFNGPVTFTYQICDGATPALCDEGLVTIVVGSLNDVPVVPVTPQVTPEDTPISVCFPIIDEAVDNHTVTVCGVENGTTTATVNNATDQVCITFTPAANYNGPAEVCLTVCDNGNPVLCTTVIVPITVTPVNDAPVAVDDIFAGSEDTPTNGDVSPNDDPTDGPTSIFSLTPTDVVNTTTEGTLAFNPDGSFVFTPINNFNGTVTFTYQICDGATPNLCDEAVATIVVNSVNDVPVVPVTPQVTPEDTPISVCFPIIDEAADNHTVTVCGVENGTTTATVNNATDQVCITFTPAANYTGPAEVCLIVCDNGNPVLCTQVIVPITVTPVNDPPVAFDDTYAATEDVNLYGSVQDNDNPTDGPSAIFSLTPTDPILATEGTLVFSNNGDFVYTPAANFNGTVTFTYQICDGATPNLCDEAVVTIVVASQNDVPVVGVTPQVTPEDTPISVCFPIIDEAADNHTVTVCGVENGTTTATVNNATDQVCITFTPAANYNGPAQVCLTVCDNGNPVLCTTVIVPITVTPVNDAPIAVNDMFATPEDVAISSTVAPNDDDTDGPFAIFSLTPTDVVQPSEGTLNFNSDGTFVFTPANNFLGTVTFTYQICDGATPNLCDEAVVTIVVGSVNDVPVVPVVPQVTPEDTPITVCFPIIDDAADDHTVTVCGVTNGTVAPAINNATDEVCLTFTPNPNYNGPAEVCLTVCDNGNPVLCTTVIVPITVLPVNDVPVAVDDVFPGSEDSPVTGTVAPNDDNNDGPNPAVFSTTPTDPVQPNEGVLTFNPDGTFIFTPAPDFNGTVNFTYQICDGATPALCDEAVVTIVVAPVNDAPVAFDDYNTTNEETPVSGDVTPGTPGQDFDPDNDPLTVTVINDPTHGTLTLNPDGSYIYVPDPGFNGQDIFTYQVCDNGSPQLCDIATVLITVLPANDAPIAVDDLFNGTEDNPVTGDVSPNDDQTDGPYGTYTVTDPILPNEGTLTFNPDGTFLFTPAPDTSGTFDFSYQVCDGGTPEQCDTATVTIVIAPVNDAPIANDDTEVMLENDTLTSTVAPNDDSTDGPNAPCAVYSLVQDVQNGTLAFFPDGSYTYTPNQNFVGQDYFTYMMCDCANPAMCDVATVYITVNTICPGSLAITGFNPAAPAFCAGTSVDLTVNATSTAGFNNVGYVWNSPTGVELIGSTISANENGLYQVTVTDRNGCTATASVSVTENALPATPIVSNSGPYCEGTDASLFLTSGQTVGATYTWYSLPTNVVVGTSTAANGQLTVTGLTPGTYTYYAIATSGAGATASSASTQVVIQAIPVNISDAGATIYACGSESVDLGATYPTMGTGWWSQSAEQAASGVQIINPDDATTSVRNLVQGLNVFYWSLSNGVCIDFSVDSVYVYNDQTPIANPDQYTIASGDTLTFDVLLNDTTSTVHEYTVSVISQPTIGTLVYQGDGTFSYHFNSLAGGSDQFIYELCNANCPNQCDTALVTINRALGDDCWNTDLQNVMTPNGDGLNDQLFFPCLETGLYPNNEIHIYNRWGDRVYSAQPYNNDWKGTFKDKDLPDGSYYYVLKLNDKNGKVITGYIVIQR